MSRRPRTQSRTARPSSPPLPRPDRTGRVRWTAHVRPWHVALALGLVHLALVLLSILQQPHDGGDNASYLALARSLAGDGTYRELWDPAARPHTQYPPGWPLMLAAALRMGIGPWVGFKVMAALFSAAAVALSYLWARRVSTPGTALGVGVVLAVGTGVVDAGRWELSDPPFWAFTMLGLLAFARMRTDVPVDGAGLPSATADRPRWKTLLGPLAVASLATLLAYATRSAGLPLLVAAGAWLAWRRRWRALAVFVVTVGAFAVPWWVRSQAAGGVSYTAYLWYKNPYHPASGTVGPGGILTRIVANTVEYTTEQLPYLLTGVRLGFPAAALGMGVVGLALAGWGMRMRRPGVPELWLPLYVGLVLVWPAAWATERFLLPALPMLLLCAAEPVRLLAARSGRAVWVGAAAAGVIALSAMPRLARQVDRAAECRAAYAPDDQFRCMKEEWADFMELSRSLNGTLPADAAVLSRKPTLFWAYSGYPSRTYPFKADPDTLLAAAREAGARYVLLDYMDQVSLMYLAPVIMQRPQAFCVMTGVGPGRATLMGIQPGAERMPNVRDRPGNVAATLPFPGCRPEFWAPVR
ncbi:MAG TPA: hypothetical protein VE871_07950 [Longimicrobium sp.]|nr:hypothetical protein [Longimicrobium sp.]